MAEFLKILLIDDDEVDRMAIRRMLDRSSMEVEILEAEDLKSGKEALEQECFDCALVDQRLPDGEGISLLQELRGSSRPKPPMILLTMLDDEAIGIQALKDGAQDYLFKGRVDASILGRAIRYAVERQRYGAELEQRNMELQQFAFVASHDLQEPLRQVAIFCKMLHKNFKGKLGDQADKWIDLAVDGAMQMRTIIHELLSYSRVDCQEMPFSPTDCGHALEVALDNLEGPARETGAEVTHDELPTVIGDGSQLTQLFQHLIGNAIKYHGAEIPQVHVSAELEGNEWVFSVRDNGIGIKAESRERIFEIFKRLHHKHEYPGTGIGLAICRRVVHRHGGRIWAESTPGSGSIFFFTIPAKSVNAALCEPVTGGHDS